MFLRSRTGGFRAGRTGSGIASAAQGKVFSPLITTPPVNFSSATESSSPSTWTQ